MKPDASYTAKKEQFFRSACDTARQLSAGQEAERIAAESLAAAEEALPCSEKKFRKTLLRETGRRCGERLKALTPAPDAAYATALQGMRAGMHLRLPLPPRKKRLFALCSCLAAALLLVAALCAAFLPRGSAPISDQDMITGRPMTDRYPLKIGESFVAESYYYNAEAGTYLTCVSTGISVYNGLNVDGTAYEGYFLVAELVISSNFYCNYLGSSANDSYITQYEYVHEGDLPVKASNSVLHLNADLTQALSTADLHFYDKSGEAPWGETHGIANFVYALEEADFAYLYGIKDTHDAVRDEYHLGDIRIYIFGVSGLAPAEFNFYAHEIDFIGC